MPKKLAEGTNGTETAAEQKRLTINPTFDQETYDRIIAAAAEDERSPANWLARFVRQKLAAPTA